MLQSGHSTGTQEQTLETDPGASLSSNNGDFSTYSGVQSTNGDSTEGSHEPTIELHSVGTNVANTDGTTVSAGTMFTQIGSETSNGEQRTDMTSRFALQTVDFSSIGVLGSEGTTIGISETGTSDAKTTPSNDSPPGGETTAATSDGDQTTLAQDTTSRGSQDDTTPHYSTQEDTTSQRITDSTPHGATSPAGTSQAMTSGEASSQGGASSSSQGMTSGEASSPGVSSSPGPESTTTAAETSTSPSRESSTDDGVTEEDGTSDGGTITPSTGNCLITQSFNSEFLSNSPHYFLSFLSCVVLQLEDTVQDLKFKLHCILKQGSII